MRISALPTRCSARRSKDCKRTCTCRFRIAGKAKSKDAALSGSLQRAIPIFLSEPQLLQIGGKPEDASLEVHILVQAEEHDARITRQREAKMSPWQAGQEVIKRAGNQYDSLVLDGLTKIFSGQIAGASP
jgi:hypothetical protein